MNKIKETTTSQSGEMKVKRAVNQIANAERLIASLPRIYWIKNEKTIRQIVYKLQETRDKIMQELADPN